MKDFLNQPFLSYFIILSCQQVSSVLRCINTYFITVSCLCCLLCISSNQQIRVDVSSLTLFSVSHTAGFISHRSLKHRKNKSCRIKHIKWISFSSCAADQSVSPVSHSLTKDNKPEGRSNSCSLPSRIKASVM